MKYFFITLFILITFFGIGVYIFAESKPKSVNQIVDDIIKPYMQEEEIPGAAIAIYNNGEKYFFNYGFANIKEKKFVTSNTIFEIASITKVFTATLLAVETERGDVKLNEAIASYIPMLRGLQRLPIDQVTFKELATHTASFPRGTQGFGVDTGDKQALFNAFKEWQPSYQIGTKFKYSNVSFGTLGVVLQNVTKRSYDEMLEKDILEPLDMHSTYVYVPEKKMDFYAQGYNKRNNRAVKHFEPTAIVGGGELKSSALDLMKFMIANMNVKVANADQELLNAMQFAQKPYFRVNRNFTMGLGWALSGFNGGKLVSKGGANHGFTSFIAFLPGKKIGVVVLFNKNGVRPGEIARKILKGLQPLS